MSKRLILLLFVASCALAQDDADIPTRFRGIIDEDLYQRLHNDYLNLLRGLPADPALRENAIRQMNTQRFSKVGIAAVTPTWNPLGPSPIPNGQTGQFLTLAVSGRTTAFQIDPTNSNKIYLGTAQGGVYRSLDAGATWTQIFDGANSSAIGALALAPSDPTKLFVGTGEANSSCDSYAGVGMYRIDNVATTATLVGPINPVRNYNDGSGNPQSVPVFNGSSISSILVHPTDPSIVFVGTTGGVIGIGCDGPLGNTIPPIGMRGVYRLTNATSAAASVVAQKLTVTLAGSGFDTPNTGMRSVSSMVMEPGNPNTLLVWIIGLAAAGDGGVYRSTNALTTASFTPQLTTTTASARGQLAIYKEGANPAVAYVATGESSTGRLRVSVDGGVTWSAFLAGGQGFCGGQCFYNIGLDVLPGTTTAQTDDIIVLGGNTSSANNTTRLFAKSTNGGGAFTESSSGLHPDTHFIRIDPSNSNVIYHGDDGGIFKSVTGGTTWFSLNTVQLNDVQFSGLAVHPTDPVWSIGGTQDNGTNMRKADGTWTRVDVGDGGYALVDRNATNTTNMTLYHTYFNQTNNLIGFARVLSTTCATDGGWAIKGIYTGPVNPNPLCDGSDTFNGIPITDAVLFYAPMVLGPGNPNTVYFGAGGVYRSTNKGDTVTLVSQRTSSPVSTIDVSPQDDNYRIFGRQDGSVLYTTTGSITPTTLAGIPAKYVARAKFDPNNKNTAYITLGGYFGGTATNQSHVWKVINLSTTPVVTGINNGLPDVPVNAFAVNPADSTKLYAGTDIGVYASTDSGATWSPFGTGLPVVAVFGMEVAPSNKLRIATHGRGMWDISIAPPPTITNVTSTLANGTYGIGTTVPIQVTFSAPVNVTGLPLLALNTTGIAIYASGSGTNTLTFNDLVGAGHNTADLDYASVNALTLNAGTINDTGGLSATLTLPTPGASGSLGFNKNIVINTILGVSNVTSSTANATYGAGALISIQVTFTGNVTVTGNPQLALNSGGTANYTSGSGTNTLTFTYVVGAGQNSADLDYTTVNALTLNGGTIKDSAAVAAILTLASPGASGSLGFNKSIVISVPPPLQFVPITPCRVMDTRGANAPLGGPALVGGATRSIPVPTSACGIPASAKAYSLNATVVPAAGTLGFLTLWPTGQAQPGVSTLNAPDGSTLANAAIVPAGTAGSIDVFALQNTDFVLDINGYFVAPGAGTLAFYPLAPCRVVDTRATNGTFGGPFIPGGTSRSFPFKTSTCGVPAAAQAYSTNVTVVPHGFLGFITAWPTGQPQPGASVLNAADGSTLANAALVPAGSSNGSVSFFASNDTDLVVDINGYFAPPGAGSLNFYTVNPCRVADTRNATGPLGGPIMNAGSARTFPLPTGACGLPVNSGAYSLNVTVAPPAFMGFLTAWPTGQAQPTTSTLNDAKGIVTANAAIIPAGTAGGLDVFVLNQTHVIIDVNGYFGQ
jgi:hypothetical protein